MFNQFNHRCLPLFIIIQFLLKFVMLSIVQVQHVLTIHGSLWNYNSVI